MMPEQVPVLLAARERVDAGRLAAWASAWLAGSVSYDDAVSAVTRDRQHQLVGLPQHPEPVPLGWALTGCGVPGQRWCGWRSPCPGT